MNEIITDYLDAKQLADRLTALELHSTSELARLEQERDEALSQIAQAECRAERFCQERDEAKNEILGWENKWKCAIDMAARAELERDEALKCAKEYYVEFIRNASSDNKVSKPNPINPFYIAFVALFLVSCTYAPRSTNQTYTARQMAIGVTSQPNGMTSTTTAEQSPVIATYPEVRVAEPVISSTSNFLTIGSTKNDVVRIQGTPIEVTKYAYSGEETWRYGYSFITLKNGLVYEWKNRCNILKVKM